MNTYRTCFNVHIWKLFGTVRGLTKSVIGFNLVLGAAVAQIWTKLRLKTAIDHSLKKQPPMSSNKQKWQQMQRSLPTLGADKH